MPVAEQWFRQKTIVELFDDELIADVSYFLAWKAEAMERPGVRALHDWILERFTSA